MILLENQVVFFVIYRIIRLFPLFKIIGIFIGDAVRRSRAGLPNGRKVFWGRGNGWVLGGLAEILKELPAKDKNRKFYEELFVKLCTRVAKLQNADGFWHASLLDPASYPSPETSCTTFIVYALAYGINEGLLDKDTFLPILVKGWNAQVSAVDADGKLGYVQPIGADPKKVTRNMTEVYGVGAFLMGGCEIYKMAR